MRAILERCIAMDEFARDIYESMSLGCGNAQLSDIFRKLSMEESHHVDWWSELLRAYNDGLIPDVVNDTEGLEHHLADLSEEIRAAVPDDLDHISDDERLDIAARLEFFMLDPVFGELLDLTEPGRAGNQREAYTRHVERLVGAIEEYYGESDLARFLARILRRTWRDNILLSDYAVRDSLTQLYNRRGLRTHLEHWLAWARRYDRPLGVLLVDVDDFKRVNDTFGHTVGDLALRAVGDAIRTTVRDSDLVARYGGDEFAVVAPETDVAELSVLAERLVESAREARVTGWDGEPVVISISVGGAVMTAPKSESPADAILAAADRSLYAAKQSGKNRAGSIDDYSPSASSFAW